MVLHDVIEMKYFVPLLALHEIIFVFFEPNSELEKINSHVCHIHFGEDDNCLENR